MSASKQLSQMEQVVNEVIIYFISTLILPNSEMKNIDL